jgi:hypothetical protein
VTTNAISIALLFVGLFFVGGVISLIKQGLKLGAVICVVGAAMAITAGVLWW